MDSRISAIFETLALEPHELVFPRLHLVLGEAEVMADLVQQGELNLVDQPAAVAALGEQRLPVEHDDVRKHIAVPATPLVEGTPV